MKRKPDIIRAPLQPIVVSELWERVQFDLIDMRGNPDGPYCWILHIRDHFGKFSTAYPLCSKRSREVANALLACISIFGPPKILQCNNGKEFKGTVLMLVKLHGVTLINGWPRHPETQGLIEQANRGLKSKLYAWKEELKTNK